MKWNLKPNLGFAYHWIEIRLNFPCLLETSPSFLAKGRDYFLNQRLLIEPKTKSVDQQKNVVYYTYTSIISTTQILSL